MVEIFFFALLPNWEFHCSTIGVICDIVRVEASTLQPTDHRLRQSPGSPYWFHSVLCPITLRSDLSGNIDNLIKSDILTVFSDFLLSSVSWQILEDFDNQGRGRSYPFPLGLSVLNDQFPYNL